MMDFLNTSAGKWMFLLGSAAVGALSSLLGVAQGFGIVALVVAVIGWMVLLASNGRVAAVPALMALGGGMVTLGVALASILGAGVHWLWTVVFIFSGLFTAVLSLRGLTED